MPTYKQYPYTGPRPIDQAFGLLAQGFIDVGKQNRMERVAKEARDVGWAREDILKSRERDLNWAREDALRKGEYERADALRAEQMFLGHKMLQEQREYEKGLTAEERTWKEKTAAKEEVGANIRTILPTAASKNMLEFAPPGRSIVFKDMYEGGYQNVSGIGNLRFKAPKPLMTTPEGYEISDLGELGQYYNVKKSQQTLSGEPSWEDFRGWGSNAAQAVTAQLVDSPFGWKIRGAQKGSENPYSPGTVFQSDDEVAAARERFYADVADEARKIGERTMVGAWQSLKNPGQQTKTSRTGGQPGEIYVYRKSDGQGGWIPETEFLRNQELYERE